MKYIIYAIYSLYLLIKLIAWDSWCVLKLLAKILWNFKVPKGLWFEQDNKTSQYVDNPNKYIFFRIKLILKDGFSEDSLYGCFKRRTDVLDTRKFEWVKKYLAGK